MTKEFHAILPNHSATPDLRRQIMERAGAVIDTVSRVQAGQYVVIEASGPRLVSGPNPLDNDEMPPLIPFDLK